MQQQVYLPTPEQRSLDLTVLYVDGTRPPMLLHVTVERLGETWLQTWQKALFSYVGLQHVQCR